MHYNIGYVLSLFFKKGLLIIQLSLNITPCVPWLTGSYNYGITPFKTNSMIPYQYNVSICICYCLVVL